MLLGEYFSDNNHDDLTVSGFVNLDYLGRCCRRLLGNGNISCDRNKRNLFEESDVTGLKGTKFTLDVSIRT